jgi:hypothetical protein
MKVGVQKLQVVLLASVTTHDWQLDTLYLSKYRIALEYT